MINKVLDYFGGPKRFYIILFVLLFMWCGIMGFLYLKADEVTRHPCEVCAKKLNEDVTCSAMGSGYISNRVFHPNLTYTDKIR